jgi:hypothetical protein
LPGGLEGALGKHRFSVGQAVLVVSSQLADIQKGERFRVIRLLPLEGVSPQYRIVSELDGHERIAREAQLIALMTL